MRISAGPAARAALRRAPPPAPRATPRPTPLAALRASLLASSRSVLFAVTLAALAVALAAIPSCDDGDRLARCRAEALIRAAEAFRAANGYYPASAAEMGMVGSRGDGAYYQAAPGGYTVWYGTFLGASAIYDGAAKEWER